MSDYHNLDLRSPERRRSQGGAFNAILITIGVVVVLFVVLAVLGAINGSDVPTVPAGDATQSEPAATGAAGE